LRLPDANDNIKTMYLPRSSRWSMTRRRKRPNLFSWTIFGLVVLFGYYFNQIYLPAQPNPFEATPTVTRSPESLATEAENLFKDGKLLPSIEAYQEAIKASPQNPALYIAVARIQVWAGQYEEAKANAENALLLNPENSMAYAVHAWALDFLGGEENRAEALNSIQKAIDLDDRNALAHAYYAEILIDTGLFENYDLAADHSRIALTLDPALLEARRARAYVLENVGADVYNYEQAIQEYKAAIAINPNIPILHMELGRNLRFLEVYEEAIKEFTIANTLNPEDPEPDLLISRTYATIGDYAKAIQYAEQAVKDRATDPNLRGNYGVMLFRNFLYQPALEQLERAVKGGKTEDGLPITGMSLAVGGRVVEYYYTYGLALARTNQCGEALKISQQIKTAVPTDENAVFAADEMIRICEENLANPPEDTPAPTDVEETAEPETETPTPEVTSTP
jgi:tetratricopeptide (TPR) repeat protein